MAEVSIIVPIYNTKKSALMHCIDSILQQEYRDFELFLIDDGSTRAYVRKVIETYAAQDPRVIAVFKKNTGVSDTRNCGIRMARGTYIQFVDSDDWISPDATKLFVRAAEDHGVQLVVADFYRVVDQNVSEKGSIDAAEEVISREKYADYMLQAPANYYFGVLWNKFYRRDILVRYDLCMDPDISWCEDFIFNMEYILHTTDIYVLKSPVYYYVRTEDSLVMTSGTSMQSTLRMKRLVIEYYDRFYRELYREKRSDYYLRKPVILGFLLDFAKDGTCGMLDGTKKLGAENVAVYFPEAAKESFFSVRYCEEKVLERYQRSIARQYGLTKSEVAALTCLMVLDTALKAEEIADYTHLPVSQTEKALQRLRHRNLVLSSDSEDGTYHLPDTDAPVYRAIARMDGDIARLRYEGFTEEERSFYRAMEQRIARNLKRILILPPSAEPEEDAEPAPAPAAAKSAKKKRARAAAEAATVK